MVKRILKKPKKLIAAVFMATLAIVFVWPKLAGVGRDYCLSAGYDFYKKHYMSYDGRIMDPQRDYVTTSEGQSYMLLRSLLLKDRKTFDLVKTWSDNNLRRPDKLYGWLWGKNSAGDYKILDDNAASDADVDIAYALLLAYEQWRDKKYLNEALLIINSIWEKETKQIGPYLVLMPGVNQVFSEKIEINPSYFSPVAFKLFQKYDKTHDWNKLIDSSYYYLGEVTSKTKTGLPPDWFLIDDAGNVVVEDSPRGDFSYDAIRVFPRIFLDYKRTGEQRALPILEKSKFFVEKWKESKKLYVNYKANGELKNEDRFIGSIALLVPVINMYDPKVAAEIYNTELSPYFREKGYWDNKQEYYGRNLLWFGCYLYDNYR